jgi:hypothetical protein
LLRWKEKNFEVQRKELDAKKRLRNQEIDLRKEQHHG